MGAGNNKPITYYKIDKETGRLCSNFNEETNYYDYIEGYLTGIYSSDFEYTDKDTGELTAGKSLKIQLSDKNGIYYYQTSWYSNIGTTIFNCLLDGLEAFPEDKFALFKKLIRLSFGKTKPNKDGKSFYRVSVLLNLEPLQWKKQYTEIPDKKEFFDLAFDEVKSALEEFRNSNNHKQEPPTAEEFIDEYGPNVEDDDVLPF